MKSCNCNQQIYAVPDKTQSSYKSWGLTGRKIPFSDVPELSASFIYPLIDVYDKCFCCRNQGGKGFSRRKRTKKSEYKSKFKI